MVIGEAQIILHGFGRRLSETELQIDFFDRHRLDLQPLASPQLHQRTRRVQQCFGADEQIVGAVARVLQTARSRRRHRRVIDRFGIHCEVAPAGFSAKPQPAVGSDFRVEQPSRLRSAHI